jgi:pseudouridine-5'-monophosphatase
VVCTVDDVDVKRGKPAPDCFEICAQRFAVQPLCPKNVLVFEDSPAGVQGALAAGMQVVFCPDAGLKHSQEATIILKSLKEFEPVDFNLPAYN